MTASCSLGTPGAGRAPLTVPVLGRTVRPPEQLPGHREGNMFGALKESQECRAWRGLEVAQRYHCSSSPARRSPARPRGAAWGSLLAGQHKVVWGSVSQLCPPAWLGPCRWLCWDLGPLRVRYSPGTRHGAGAGLGAPAPLPGSGPAPSRCSPMSSSASLIVSFNMASWPENNQLGHLASVRGFFTAGFSARRGLLRQRRAGPPSRSAGRSSGTSISPLSHLRPPAPWPWHGELGVLDEPPRSVRAPRSRVARTAQAAVCARGARAGCGVWGCPAQGDKVTSGSE